MFASLLLVLAAGAGQLSIPLGKTPPHVEQPRAPVQSAGPSFARICEGSDDWNKPAPPVRIHGFKATGEDDRLAGPFSLLRVADERLGRHFGQQVVERLAVVWLVEEVDERFGNDRSHALHRRQFRLSAVGRRHTPKLFDRTEAFQQVLGRDDAHMPDA